MQPAKVSVTGAAVDFRENPKQAAVDQWTADPCGTADFEPGTREYFEALISSFGEQAPWLDQELGYADTAGMSVLDVGCGQGVDLARYAMAGASVTGVDLTPRHVELARAHMGSLGLKAEVVEGDAEALPFPDRSFDRVSSNGVLHHTPDMPAALREIRRVLRPGGETRIVVYNRSSLYYWLTQVLHKGLIDGQLFRERSMAGVLSGNVERSSIGARPLVRVYSPRQVRALLADAGFERVSTRVRHFHVDDTLLTSRLAGRLLALRDPETLDRIGRRAGWYIVGRGTRPPL
jgi:ubiquinone/menaquinone biosynthesis C-methylase UbiE